MNSSIDKNNLDIIEIIGKKVFLESGNNREYGVIVNAWWDKELKTVDCHVAFYPDGNKHGYTHDGGEKPYVLRYLFGSLTLVDVRRSSHADNRSIKLQRHNTVISDGDLVITDARWGGGEFSIYNSVNNTICRKEPDSNFPKCELCIKVFDRKTESIYRITFPHTFGFRLLDEGGLLDFWGASDYDEQIVGSVIIVTGSPWGNESTIPFVYSDGVSYMVVTDNECVEVITNEAPEVELVEKILPLADK